MCVRRGAGGTGRSPMSLLYRTPNVVMAGAEWHASVELRAGTVRRYFRFRRPGKMWQPMDEWEGHRPKSAEMHNAFGIFKRHMLRAEQSVAENAVLLRGRAA